MTFDPTMLLMRLAVLMMSAISMAVVASAQILTLKSPVPQQVTVAASASAAAAAPGETVMLWADVTPRPRIHVYAAGARTFVPVAIVATPLAGVTFRTPVYPPSQLQTTIGVSTPVPAYRTTFRIAQPVRLGRTLVPGKTLTLAAAINYQACDDRVCYPAASVPVLWALTVK